MHIKGDYLTNLFLKTDSQLFETNIPWRQGDLVTGLVETVKGNGLVQLMVRGKSLEAQTEIPLFPGQKLSLYVNEVRPGYVHLRVLVPEIVANPEQQKLVSALNELGIRPDDRTIGLAAKLVKNELPVTRENLTRLLRITSFLGPEDAGTEEISAWMVSRNTQLSPQHILALKRFLTSENNLALLLAEVRDGLKAIVEGQNAIQEENSASPPPLTQILQGGSGDKVQGEKTLEVTTPGRSGSDGRSGQVSSGKPTSVTAGIPLPLLEDMISRLVEAITLKIEETGSLLPGEIKRLVENQLDATRASAALEQVVANSLPKTENGSVEQVLNKLKVARYELEGQHLFNVLNNLPRDNTQLLFYLAFPVMVGQDYHLCELKVMKDGAGKQERRSEKDAFSLVLSLSTGTLGLVLFHVTYYPQKSLVLQAVAQNHKAGSRLQAQLPELAESLERLGFEIKGWTVKVADSGQRALKQSLVRAKEPRRWLGIDIVV
ncbi:MAG: hypothetical protein HPY90_03690 [Syntrophothermus sp.]|uniref:hypothetical protein n=1 Tax=Syntrophothermus sp. TaxID=2736299 RepID=UPI00257E9BB1|nr:hypothetical protein [Syntrophothermus sp.]NSW82368.1 hypothetical protein [Syntrophothermus sp.]